MQLFHSKLSLLSSAALGVSASAQARSSTGRGQKVIPSARKTSDGSAEADKKEEDRQFGGLIAEKKGRLCDPCPGSFVLLSGPKARGAENSAEIVTISSLTYRDVSCEDEWSCRVYHPPD